jgi:dienelactone hydrolase
MLCRGLRRPTLIAALAAAGPALPAFAQPPAASESAAATEAAAAPVRPVPPPGIALKEADRRQLETDLSTLAQETKRLRARPELAALTPDVEIYYRAVDSAFRYGEFFDDEALGKARALLATGRERAKALASGRTPWLEQPGPTALGYLSKIDGSIQPYGLYLPERWGPRQPGRWRLDAWFHGRAEKLSEVEFLSGVSKSGGPFAGPEAITLQPYGRYCNGSKFAGEVDFFEALADAKRRFPIDEDRIVIRGFSLGGASAWHLGAHHAWQWAAVAPGAGFSESREFLTVFAKEKLDPTWWEAKLWQLYDAPPYVENFRNVPVVAYSGEKDRQKQAADVMEKALSTAGIQLVHLIGPDTEHKYHPDTKAELSRQIDALATRGRVVAPRKVTLVTPTLKYNRQSWVQADALGEHWTPARIDAEMKDDGPTGAQVLLHTRNVTALSLLIPGGHTRFFPGRPVTVVIDGQRLPGPPVASDRSWTARFHRDGRRWRAGTAPAEGLHKRHDLQGPIDDAFMDSFVVVTPSGKPYASAVGEWVYAEQMRALKEWRRQFRAEPRARQDKMVTAEDIAAHNLVLWGDPQSNQVLGRIIDKLPIRWSKEGLSVGKQTFSADQHAAILVFPNPLNPARYVVLNSGFTFREYDYLNNARQTPKLPDWAVVDVSVKPDARAPGKIVAADFFGERWELRRPTRRPAATTTIHPGLSAAGAR